MHDALAYPRLHQPKNHVIGRYDPQSTGDACVVIDNARGVFYRTMGTADRQNRVWLLPEEALWLLERGSLDIRWSSSKEDNQNSDQSVPMSLQAAYATLMGRSGLTLEKYQVFAGLKRTGYTVQRAATWHAHTIVQRPKTILAATKPPQTGYGLFAIFRRVLSAILAPPSVGSLSSGPLVAPGLYRNYAHVYQSLSLIPFHQPEDSFRQENPYPKPSFRVTYDVYKPTTSFKKSMPPKPDFRIAVLDARTTQVPALQEISALLDSLDEDLPSPEKKLEIKLKYGYRNVLLAVVDTGVVSYLRLSDSVFGRQKVYEQKKHGGRKRGPRKSPAKAGSKPG